ncbi:hypothetical protein PMAYCL1PPCAC_29476, partial [Pristionchus mayeri]
LLLLLFSTLMFSIRKSLSFYFNSIERGETAGDNVDPPTHNVPSGSIGTFAPCFKLLLDSSNSLLRALRLLIFCLLRRHSRYDEL